MASLETNFLWDIIGKDETGKIPDIISGRFNKEKRTMKNLISCILCLAVLVCLGCGTSPVGIDATYDTDGGDVLYRKPAPKPDCKIVKCGPPPIPGE